MIKLLVIDVDGTMTDGKITYIDNNGELLESKQFCVKDGLAISVWSKKLGLKVAIITGRKSKVVEKRAKELGVNYLYQGVDNKLEILQAIMEHEGISKNEIAAIGDDLNDYKMLDFVGLAFCPQNASAYIKNIVHKVCEAKGGEGAVREAIEYICKTYDLEDEFLSAWL
ncbi:MAG: HAD hydrolase family protein [Arcobacter butzleri]|nr:HAD hydrolase family protein [Arcobacteraceae bacterium]NLO17213.1 HAD hydrolase family protein [Aliarcobacter butzleri]